MGACNSTTRTNHNQQIQNKGIFFSYNLNRTERQHGI